MYKKHILKIIEDNKELSLDEITDVFGEKIIKKVFRSMVLNNELVEVESEGVIKYKKTKKTKRRSMTKAEHSYDIMCDYCKNLTTMIKLDAIAPDERFKRWLRKQLIVRGTHIWLLLDKLSRHARLCDAVRSLLEVPYDQLIFELFLARQGYDVSYEDILELISICAPTHTIPHTNKAHLTQFIYVLLGDNLQNLASPCRQIGCSHPAFNSNRIGWRYCDHHVPELEIAPITSAVRCSTNCGIPPSYIVKCSDIGQLVLCSNCISSYQFHKNCLIIVALQKLISIMSGTRHHKFYELVKLILYTPINTIRSNVKSIPDYLEDKGFGADLIREITNMLKANYYSACQVFDVCTLYRLIKFLN